MVKMIDRTGIKYGRLTVLEKVDSDKKGNARWLCRCDCGNEKIILGWSLANRTRSCGCIQKEVTSKRAKIHGLYGTHIHTVWRHMKERCKNPNSKDFVNYGGRGIKLFQDWEKLENFFEWSKKNGYNEGLSIERIDVNGNYEPDNCKWITLSEQWNNKQDTVRIEINGITKTLKEWAVISGVKHSTIRWRYRNGITGEELLTKGRLKYRKK
ncbi:hypothetical protein [Bacillus toyonensis]|uniref:hypothetical protein n=1 Tax=Bacillus toyonensis TaxID=155322 RepID=UPI000BF03835|nr:hypothetical protein [Bacillus toyonensis]PEI49943.1 hypothetical protein CN631_15875 [Bacillus toyonensis]